MEREISIILKVKGAEAAKKAVQDVFKGQTKQAVDSVNKGLKRTGDNMKRVGSTSKKAGRSMQSFTKVLGRGMAALYLYNRAWQTFGRNFEMGLQLERASTQFERHVGNVNRMLPQLRSVTRGVVDDFELLKTANRAFQQGIKPSQISKAFSLATSAAQKLGLSSRDAINTMTDAITTQNEGSLKTLGIITNVNQAYKTQVALIAKTGGVMSKAMSIQLRQSLIMKEIERRFGGVNKVQDDGLMILERFKASWTNFRATLGKTISIGLLPLTRALTGVLDVTTALLTKMNDTRGFHKFIQGAVILAGVWGTSKFLKGASSLINLFGVMSNSKGANAASRLVGFLGVIPRILGRVSGLLLGWPGVIAALVIDFDTLGQVMSTAWTAGKVLFQLLNSYNSNTGLSRVLKEDVDKLGKFYNAIENGAKRILEFASAIRGFAQGTSEAFQPLFGLISSVISPIASFTEALFTQARAANLVNDELDGIASKYNFLAKVIGPTLVGTVGGGLLGGLPGAIAGGTAGAVYSAATSKEASGVAQMAAPEGVGSHLRAFYNTFNPNMNQQTSNQTSTPSPRSMNLDYSNDQSDTSKKAVKILEKIDMRMEEEAQKKEIRESQKNANGNIMLRRTN